MIADLKYALRSLGKTPGFTVVAILTLALGIGASTAIFSVLDAVLLRPLPYPNQERIVELRELDEKGQGMSFAEPNFDDLRARSRSFEALAKYSAWTARDRGRKRTGARQIPAAVSGGFLSGPRRDAGFGPPVFCRSLAESKESRGRQLRVLETVSRRPDESRRHGPSFRQSQFRGDRRAARRRRNFHRTSMSGSRPRFFPPNPFAHGAQLARGRPA